MKLLHTSDWHVGRTIRGRSRAQEHRDVLSEIATIAHAEEPDLILVAGDQFDTAQPSPESEQIVYQALLDLAATGAQVVVIAGNHDNPRRWGAIRPLLSLTNVHTIDQVRPPDRGGVLDLPCRDGSTARLALLPWVSHRTVISAQHLMTTTAAGQEQEFSARVRDIVQTLSADFSADTVNLLMGHLTVLPPGGAVARGGGERESHILGYQVSPSVFSPNTQYVALGHLHRAHRVNGPCPIHYSGAPLHLDFGEAFTEHKQVTVVEAVPGAPADVRPVELASGRRLRTLRGPADLLRDDVDQYGDDHLRIILEEAPRTGLGDEFRELFPNAVDVRIAPPDGVEAAEAEAWELEQFQASPSELFAEYLSERGEADPELLSLLSELIEEDDDAQRGATDATSAA